MNNIYILRGFVLSQLQLPLSPNGTSTRLNVLDMTTLYHFSGCVTWRLHGVIIGDNSSLHSELMYPSGNINCAPLSLANP